MRKEPMKKRNDILSVLILIVDWKQLIFLLFEMIETSTEQQIHYIGFNELRNPEFSEISINNIEEGFQSKEWRKNF